MFNPVPPAADERAAVHPESDHEPIPALTAWRPRGRWPALFRLSWLCRLLALLSAIACGFWALFGMMMAAQGGEQGAQGLFTMLGALLSAFISYIVWMGLAELILLFIAIERNVRQTRDRLPKPVMDAVEALPAREPFGG